MSKRLPPLIPAGLLVQQLLPTSDHITITARPRQNSATCPDCAVPSRRVHSRYDRRLGDLPWQGRPVTLRVQARRFRCLNPACPRQTFAERLAGVAAVAARRTGRLGDLQRCLGLALGGEAGARLAARLAMPASPDTLLRLACATGGDAGRQPSPRVLGVDDWAWRRGHRYGTALVDLKRNRVVERKRSHDGFAPMPAGLPAGGRQVGGGETVNRHRSFAPCAGSSRTATLDYSRRSCMPGDAVAVAAGEPARIRVSRPANDPGSGLEGAP